MSEKFVEDTSMGSGAAKIGDEPKAVLSSPDMLGKALSHEADLVRDQGQQTVDDFINFAETYASKAQADQSARSFNDMSDAELMECLSEYLGSGVANVSINNSLIEEMQRLVAEAFMSEDELEELDNPTSARAMDAKRRKFADRLGDILEDQENRQEERRQLEEWEKEILAGQMIDTGVGPVSALDIVNSADSMLDDWDNSFADMVAQGAADPADKNKLRKAITKYRNMMADPSLSAADKQKLRQEMVQSGTLSQSQMNYMDQKEEKSKIYKRSSEDTLDADDRNCFTRKSDSTKPFAVSVTDYAPAYKSLDDGKPTINSNIVLIDKFSKAANIGERETPPERSQDLRTSPSSEKPSVAQRAATMSADWG